jgi:hypothetical protein
MAANILTSKLFRNINWIARENPKRSNRP